VQNADSQNEKKLGLIFSQAAKAGDLETMASVVASLSSDIQRYASALLPVRLRRLVDENDIHQEVALKLFDAIDRYTYQDEDRFRHWVFNITRFVVLDTIKHYTSKKRSEQERVSEPTKTEMESLTRLWQVITSGDPTPSRQVTEREIIAHMLEAVDDLKPEYRALIDMRHFQEMTFEQIGQELRQSPDAVRMRYNRAIKVLQESIEQI